MMAQTILAVLLAKATVTTRTGLRASKAMRLGSAASGFLFACRTTAVMPTTSSLRRYLSPIFVMRPSRSLPPLDFCYGVSPSQAANCRSERN